jgi:secreted trypsin-like serine protease
MSAVAGAWLERPSGLQGGRRLHDAGAHRVRATAIRLLVVLLTALHGDGCSARAPSPAAAGGQLATAQAAPCKSFTQRDAVKVKRDIPWLIGGAQPANEGFAYVAALYIDPTSLRCGGAVLDGGWVLTAAHCGLITKVVGGRDLLSDTGQGWDRQVETCYRHSLYDSSTLANDIALVKIKNPPSGLATIPLVENADWEAKTAAVTILGYADTCGSDTRLCSATVDLVCRPDCKEDYRHNDVGIDCSTLCTSTLQAGIHPGDSGGPVVAEIDGAPRLVGVISSWAASLPDREMLVSHYLQWIKDVESGNPKKTTLCGGDSRAGSRAGRGRGGPSVP